MQKFTEPQKRQIEDLFNGLIEDELCPAIISASESHFQFMHFDGTPNGDVIKMLLLNENGKLVAHQQ